jgi:hypothetical protein
MVKTSPCIAVVAGVLCDNDATSGPCHLYVSEPVTMARAKQCASGGRQTSVMCGLDLHAMTAFVNSEQWDNTPAKAEPVPERLFRESLGWASPFGFLVPCSLCPLPAKPCRIIQPQCSRTSISGLLARKPAGEGSAHSTVQI